MKTKMRAFITGGGGFLGSYIVDLLLKEGHEVVSYSRGLYPALEDKGVECVRGDLSDLPKIIEASRDCDVIFHVASKVAMWGKIEDFCQTNVIGTENVIKAAKVNGIPHLVYTSTPSVVFGRESLQGVDESISYAKDSVSRYGASKAEAESLVLKASGKDLKTVSLRPHLIFGPGDQNLIPRLIERARSGKLKIVGSGENLVDVLYVENGADAHIKAWKALLGHSQGSSKRDIGGEAFFIGQGPVKLWDFINTLLKEMEMKPIRAKIPFWLAYIVGFIFEKTYQLLNLYRKDPPMTRFVSLQLNCDHYFNHQKAKELLGWAPEISIEDGLGRTIRAMEVNKSL